MRHGFYGSLVLMAANMAYSSSVAEVKLDYKDAYFALFKAGALNEIKNHANASIKEAIENLQSSLESIRHIEGIENKINWLDSK